MTAEITLYREDLRALFDIAVNALDFGSGMLDDAEVETLRRVAVVLGVDPLEATPRSHMKNYPHTYVDTGYGYGYCDRCGRGDDEFPHRVER